MNAAQCIVVGLLRLYQWILSPLLVALCPGAGCRFTPTCSEFAVQAVQSGGVLRGTGQALRRLMRCHPWGGCGCDPLLPPPSGHSAAAH